MDENIFNQKQVLAFFGRLVSTGCFKSDRDYAVGIQLLKSHLNLDYESFEYADYCDEMSQVLHNESLLKTFEDVQ